MELLIQMMPAIGQTAGLLLALFFFLEYQKKRDSQASADMDKLITRVENISADNQHAIQFLATRQENITNTLMAINRDTVVTMTGLSNAIHQLTASVLEQRSAIYELRKQLEDVAVENRRELAIVKAKDAKDAKDKATESQS